MSKLYNHAFDMAFSICNSDEEGHVSSEKLLMAIIKKAVELHENDELVEACGVPFDSYEVEISLTN